jgi:Fe-S cluster assembly protein SufD
MSQTAQDDALVAPSLSTDHSRATADEAHTHGRGGTPQSSRAARLTSFDLADFVVPTGREEEWRFSPVARFVPLFDADGTGISGTST